MSNLTQFKLAEKVRASGQRGIIIGLLIAALIIAAVVFAVIKIRWMKKHLGCEECDFDDFDEDFTGDDASEEECACANEKDFV